jgi:epoxyqueuosine reductase
MFSSADTDWVVQQAETLGFNLCGVAPAEGLADVEHTAEWLARGYAGQMRYLHDERRTDLRQVLPNAQSVIVCALNYNADAPQSMQAAANAAAGQQVRGWISRYAWGDDYHHVLLEKLDQLVCVLRERFGGQFESRAYVDTGPVPERAAASRAGLGWVGKNTCLINEDAGSWFFLGVIVTSLPLEGSINNVRPAPADQCGNCRLCLDACPTGALVEPYIMDARRCISYLTIELRETIPQELRGPIGWHVFGCDICQEVCPWNRQASPSPLSAFAPREKLLAPEIEWLLTLDETEFRQTFQSSPVRRTKWRGLLRNACIAAGNAQIAGNDDERARLCARLSKLAAGDDPLIAEHASWALTQLTIMK